MRRTIRTTDGKWLEINPDADIGLLKTPRPTTRVGADYAHGEDLYLKEGPGGRHYYIISWVVTGRDLKESFHTLNEEEKDQYIREWVRKAGKIGLDPDDADRIEKFFPGLLKIK